jgi:hypothetical protein
MPHKTPHFSGKYNFPGKQLHVSLSFIEFTEDNNTILYCPALDLSGYGKDVEEAKNSFEIVLEEFLRYTMNKKTFLKELKNLGWKVKSESKPFIPPPMTYLLRKNEYFSHVFNQNSFKKYDQQVAIPVS